MLSRLIFGLALGLLMYMPRPRGDAPPGGMPPGLPPGAEEPPDIGAPPPGDGEMPELPEDPPIIGGHPPITRHIPHSPSVPPTPPPGFEGEWPPASERPDVPPTPPPGYDGIWPGERRSIIDRIIELLRKLEFQDQPGKRIGYIHAKGAAEAVGGAVPADSTDVNGS